MEYMLDIIRELSLKFLGDVAAKKMIPANIAAVIISAIVFVISILFMVMSSFSKGFVSFVFVKFMIIQRKSQKCHTRYHSP